MTESLSSSWWSVYESWPLERVEAFDRACDQIEAAWSLGSPPELGSVLADVPPAERPVWLSEFLAIEIASRWHRDEPVTIDEFLARFPDAAETVRQVWQETSPQLRTIVRPSESVAATSSPRRGDYFQPGEILEGRYRIEGLSGSGGMAELYKARRIAGDFPVAVKVLLPSPTNAKAGDEDWFRRRFKREMQILQRLRHPHLVTAWDYFESDGRPPVIVMDWVDGRSLDREVAEHKSMPWQIACEVIRQAADGLGYAWERFQLVHRDIKPTNLILTPNGHVHVLDFGLARAPAAQLASRTGGDTSVFERFGTADFTAPEQWDNAREVDSTADVYSLGATLYFLLTGEPAFAAAGPLAHQRIAANRTQSPPDIHSKRPDVPPALAEFLGEMLAKARDQRPADCGQVALRLESWTHGADLKQWYATGTVAAEPVLASTIVQPRSHPRTSRRNFLLAAGAGVVGLAGWSLSPWFLPPPEIVDFRVTLYVRLPGNTFRRVGEIGKELGSAPPGGELRVSARLSAASYVQLFEAAPDGKLRQLLNCGPSNGGPEETQPGRHLAVEYPRVDHFRLDELPGFQAFVLVASRLALPSFAEWSQRGESTSNWTTLGNQAGVWTSAGERVVQVPTDEDDIPRGQKVPAAPMPVQQLFDRTRSVLGDRARVAVFAFPIRGQ